MGSSMSTAHSVEHVPDDAVSQVLVHAPPHPATLARASLTCKFLHRFIGGAGFRRTFQAHHRSRSTPPPLLGFFHDDDHQNLPSNFLPVGDAPDRVSAAAFDPKHEGWRLVDSRHGRVLLRSPDRARFLVWDPAAGRRRYVDAPPAMQQQQHADRRLSRFMLRFSNAAVVCAAAHDHDHSGGDCHDSPFSVVLVASPDEETTVAYVYSSELGLWNQVAAADLLTTPWLRIAADRPVALVRGVLYWTMVHDVSGLQRTILAFDLQTCRLYLIEQPVYIFDAEQENVQVMESEDGLLGLVAACGLALQLWVLREYNGRGTERWGMPVQIDLQDDLALAPTMDPAEEIYMVWILCVEGRVVFVRTDAGIYEVNLWNEAAPRRICDAYDIQTFYPYRSFYYRGTGSARDEANGES